MSGTGPDRRPGTTGRTPTPYKGGVRRPVSGPQQLLDVKDLGVEFGHERFWRDIIAKRLLPTVRPPGYRRVFVKRGDVERLIDTWTEEVDRT